MIASKLTSKNFNNNQDILNKFKNSYLNSNLSHSTILYGEKGIGKSTFVKYFINMIFCKFSEVDNKIYTSQHTSLILNDSHPNFLIVSKLHDQKTKKLKNYIIIDQIRNLDSFIYQSSIYDLPKIVLIDSADDLNVSSSNALLKILEEPKKNTYFFLISHQPSRLIPTIRSRCILFKFNKPTFDEFKKILKLNNANLTEDEEIEYLFYLSKGSPGIALKLFSHDTSDTFDQFVQICKEKQILSNRILEFSSELSKHNNDQFTIFLLIVKFILSTILKINLGINIKETINNKFANKIYEISKHLNTSSCFKTLDYLNEYENNLIIYNLDKRIFTINLFSKIASS